MAWLAITAGCAATHTRVVASSDGHPRLPSAATTLLVTRLAAPASCLAPRSLAPLVPRPELPSDFRLLSAAPASFAARFPTIYAGLEVAPSSPGESAVETNSHFVVLETEHDPALESDARLAYRSPLTVDFKLAPRSEQCVGDVLAQVRTGWAEATAAVPSLESYGPDADRGTVDVGLTACTPDQVQSATQWLTRRYGDTVAVHSCQPVPHRQPMVAPLRGRE
jgi:hypothetical protein